MRSRKWRPLVLSCVASLGPSCVEPTIVPHGPWERHTIDDASEGADGARLADINGDGRPDAVTPWEEGGVIRVCLHPGPAAVRDRWSCVTVGEVGWPEDAVFADLDGDGGIDVVSSTEGASKTVFMHWAPTEPTQVLEPAGWLTEPNRSMLGTRMWMYALPLQLDGQDGVDLVVGSKGGGAEVGWSQAPADARDLPGWAYHTIQDAGWIMSIEGEDVDGDGEVDLIISDRKQERRGVYWLENPGPGPAQTQTWARHDIGGADKEVMFLAVADLDGDGLRDVVTATMGKELLFHRRASRDGLEWSTTPIEIPAEAGLGKGVAVGDVNLDGQLDVVFSCEHADDKIGVMWLSHAGSPTALTWEAFDISGRAGTKFDLVQLVDLDEDGDLDVMTCEERENLGVVWYENPLR